MKKCLNFEIFEETVKIHRFLCDSVYVNNKLWAVLKGLIKEEYTPLITNSFINASTTFDSNAGTIWRT